MIEEIWYKDVNGISEVPDNILGQGAKVTIIDSCIDFKNSEAIADKHIKSNDDYECGEWLAQEYTVLIQLEQDIKEAEAINSNKQSELRAKKNLEWIKFVHGTATAGIIAASPSVHEFFDIDNVKPFYIDKNIDKVEVEGVASKCKIQGVLGPITSLITKGAITYNKLTSKNTPLFPELQHSEMIVVNLSGGEKEVNSIKSDAWIKLINEACDHRYTLIIAAVGNSGCDLNETPQCGVWPAFVSSTKICQDQGIDPILRVGALNQYSINQEPTLYHKSNYGNKHVDILAPGQHITTLVPYNYGTVISGTSLATAIVSGLAAILISCQPYANAKEIREAILNGAVEYKSLEDKVYKGKVINILQSVKNFCFNNKKAEEGAGQEKQENVCKD